MLLPKDRQSRMLCRVLGKMPKHDVDRQDADVREWWYEHQRSDRERVRLEEARAKEREQRAAALKKLTPKERRLLGLK